MADCICFRFDSPLGPLVFLGACKPFDIKLSGSLKITIKVLLDVSMCQWLEELLVGVIPKSCKVLILNNHTLFRRPIRCGFHEILQQAIFGKPHERTTD